jgi:hypothetical protein
MQKIEWGFISQILGANFSKSACFKSFLLPLRIGRSKSNRCKKIQPNLTMKFSDTRVRIFWRKFLAPHNSETIRDRTAVFGLSSRTLLWYGRKKLSAESYINSFTNIDKNKSDMHDQRDLEIQLIMSLISSMVKQSGKRESCFDLTCSNSRIRLRDLFTVELLCW